MRRPRPDVAEVITQYRAAYEARHHPSPGQRRLLDDLERCRSAALGGHKQQCSDCGHELISYNSCRNRHCPKCQGTARAHWLAARAAELLPVPYFHIVFTLPAALRALALQNKRLLYGLLFRATAKTLRTIARDPQHLGADIGFLAVLHTWGQQLELHPHLHCIVPGGGLDPQRALWRACRPGFFLPVRVLSRHFRRTFLGLLAAAHRRGQLRLRGSLASLRDHAAWSRWLRPLRQTEWVIYAKPPFGGPLQVLKYLARYTHRVAISNRRLVSIAHGRVRFRWKDYSRGHRSRTLSLTAVEFLRRFLLHRLPQRFHHIRHYGLLGNRRRAAALALCRQLLAHPAPDGNGAVQFDDPPEPRRCPACGSHNLTITELRPAAPHQDPQPP